MSTSDGGTTSTASELLELKRELARTRNELEETCFASMAVSQGQFYIRTAEHLFCIGTP